MYFYLGVKIALAASLYRSNAVGVPAEFGLELVHLHLLLYWKGVAQRATLGFGLDDLFWLYCSLE